MLRRPIVLGVLTLCAAPAQAQSTATPSQQAGATAILRTPAGALPQIVQTRLPANGTIALRYGRYAVQDGPSFSSIGASGSVKVIRKVLAGLTIGHRSCDVCEGLTMGSVDVSASVFHKDTDREFGGTDVQLHGSAGIGKTDSSDATARSLTASVPLSVSLPQAENGLLTLFFAPALGYGYLQGGGVDDGATRISLAAGVSYSFGFGLGIHATGQRLMIEDTPMQLGFALTWLFGGNR